MVDLAHMTAAKETTLKEVGQMLTHVVAHMATKEDIADMATKTDVRTIIRKEVAPIHAEVRAIRQNLDDLREQVENVIRFRKEIDHALERIAAIEKHLGIDKKIAA
jgi:septal ring factor EnvC (AmiA/AmiB activator)